MGPSARSAARTTKTSSRLPEPQSTPAILNPALLLPSAIRPSISDELDVVVYIGLTGRYLNHEAQLRVARLVQVVSTARRQVGSMHTLAVSTGVAVAYGIGLWTPLIVAPVTVTTLKRQWLYLAAGWLTIGLVGGSRASGWPGPSRGRHVASTEPKSLLARTGAMACRAPDRSADRGCPPAD
jgi:hypothetical protein